MEIKGMNSINEFFDEKAVSVETLIYNLKRNAHLDGSDFEKYYDVIRKLYDETFSSKPKQLEVPLITTGTLFHRSPMRDSKTGEVFYDKLESIAKNGLLPVDMLVKDSDATDPTYVSFHSILENERTLDDVFKRLPQGNVDLIFFINTNTPVIQKLIKLGRYNGENYKPPTLSEILLQANEDAILKKIFQVGNIYYPDNLDVKGVYYLPIGVPASYISAIVVPDKLLQDEKFMQTLFKNFSNAIILDKNQKQVVLVTEELQF